MEHILATDVRNGKGIQEFAWKRVTSDIGETSGKECKTKKKDGLYYDLRYDERTVIPTFSHFQLRNMIVATSKHDVYVMSHFSVMHWSSLTRVKTEILYLFGNVAPCEKHPESLSEGFTKTEVSTIALKDKLLLLVESKENLLSSS